MNCNHTKRRYLILLVAITVLMIFLYNNCFPTITTINIDGAKILFNHRKLMEQQLKTKKLTFEKYRDYRIVYDDILELEKLQSFNFDLRDIHRNVIYKLYEVYRGSSSNIKKNLTPKQRFVMEQKEMICDALKSFKVLIYKQGDTNFRKMKKDHLFPSAPFLNNKRFNTCALISNSGSVIGSKLGTFIDAHDLVVRLNHAPTQGFEVDVGSKTDLRIVNSMILKKNIYNFFDISNILYHSNKTELLTFERSFLNQRFESWIKTQKPFLDFYFKKRENDLSEKFYMINYNSLWDMWKWLDSLVKYPIINYIPSSGFIGAQLLMRHCNILRLVEFIPSKRSTDLCHYFEKFRHKYCGYAGDHSLSAEKLIYYVMGNRNRDEIFDKGYVTIDTKHCHIER
ncbi:beta-galactoside alpha-2,6-sialyltransferase 2 [Lepeophtheirus salmonis]|uniref:beta-galactoside alpha-2,6-sialyltransferase 2 n=1 Tax=Lepeophtheirus salmonis TaxID=72036 RepID=UPI001AE6D96A|nr:beta-galactoside alpha-2,6-sialyltransferase 2-like [Lepeophtheirus salmonis]